MMDFLITAREALGVRDEERYREWTIGKRGRRALRRGVRPDSIAPASEISATATPAIARVDAGRWIADCPNPLCNSAMLLIKGQRGFLCGDCFNADVEARAHRALRWPANHVLRQVEELLLERPEETFMHWDQRVSIDELRRRNEDPFHHSWTAPKTYTVGSILTASEKNTYERDNMLETATAKVTTAVDIVVATGANALKRLAKGAALSILRVNSGATDLEWATIASALPLVGPGTHPQALQAATGTVKGLAWNPAGTHLAVVTSTTLYVYPWTASGGFGAAISPAVAPTNPTCVSWSPDGAYIAIGLLATPYVTVYPWTGTAVSTKVADPAALAAGQVNEIAWNPAGTYIAAAHASSPYIALWAWSGGAFGAKSSNPAALAAGESKSLAWSPTGLSIAVASSTTPYIHAWPVSAGGAFGTKFTNPGTLPSSASISIAINAAGTAVAISDFTGAPCCAVYPYSDTAFGTKATAAAVMTGASNNLAWWEYGTVSLLLVEFSAAASSAWWRIYDMNGAAFRDRQREWDFTARQIAGTTATGPGAQEQRHLAVNPITKHVAVFVTISATTYAAVIPPTIV